MMKKILTIATLCVVFGGFCTATKANSAVDSDDITPLVTIKVNVRDINGNGGVPGAIVYLVHEIGGTPLGGYVAVTNLNGIAYLEQVPLHFGSTLMVRAVQPMVGAEGYSAPFTISFFQRDYTISVMIEGWIIITGQLFDKKLDYLLANNNLADKTQKLNPLVSRCELEAYIHRRKLRV